MNRNLASILLLFVFGSLLSLASCATAVSDEARVVLDREERAYERFKSDHELRSKENLSRPGMYYDGKNFYVVLSLSNAGTDQYPEWAADKLLTSLYGYRALNQALVSKAEFSSLVLQFKLEEIVEGKYENIARIKLSEKDMEKFRREYRDAD